MEILFENKTTMTKEVLYEFTKEAYKVYKRKYRTFVLLLSIVSIFSTVTSLINSRFDWFFILMFLASLFFIFMYFNGYIFQAKQNFKNFQSLLGESPEITNKFYEDNLESITPKSVLNVDYDQITKVLETKNLYVLMIERQGVILRKEEFTIGDDYKFRSFILGKGIEL